MSSQHFDCIVLGLGGVGSAALYQLARRGVRCVGLEQFSAAHGRGSSHGKSRIIRRAYFEHPDYVPLLDRSYTMWDELQEETNARLFDRIGVAHFGRPDGVIISGIESSVRQHQLTIERPSAAEFTHQHPEFIVPEEMAIVVEQDAGMLHVERCVETHLAQAEKLGATIQVSQAVQEIRQRPAAVEVITETASFVAERLIVATGAWSATLLGLPVELRVVRKHQHWFDVGNALGAMTTPAFFFHQPHGYFYGIPNHDGYGVKLAEHSGGDQVDSPSDVSREPDSLDRQRVEEFLTNTFTLPAYRHIAHDVCLYTMTPDEHFIVDRHPQHEQILVAAGLSGHGFKFTPVLGEALVDLAIDGSTEWPIDFLSCARFPAEGC